VTFYANA